MDKYLKYKLKYKQLQQTGGGMPNIVKSKTILYICDETAFKVFESLRNIGKISDSDISKISGTVFKYTNEDKVIIKLNYGMFSSNVSHQVSTPQKFELTDPKIIENIIEFIKELNSKQNNLISMKPRYYVLVQSGLVSNAIMAMGALDEDTERASKRAMVMQTLDKLTAEITELRSQINIFTSEKKSAKKP